MNDKQDTTEQGSYVLIKGHRCMRCKHTWRPKRLKLIPTVCPKCKSPYWKQPYKEELKNTTKLSTCAIGHEFELEIESILKQKFDEVIPTQHKGGINDFNAKNKNDANYKRVECKCSKNGELASISIRKYDAEADYIAMKINKTIYFFKKIKLEELGENK
jgi:predicted  nucleic acid-binding Zn-ribbon protein